MVSRSVYGRLFFIVTLVALLSGNSLAVFSHKPLPQKPATNATPDDSDSGTRGLKPREYAQQLNVKIAAQRTNTAAPPKVRKTPSPFVAKVTSSQPLAKGEDVGVTLWLLKEAKVTDDKAVQEKTRIAVRKNGKTEEQDVVLTPTRASLETSFVDGDILRFSVEAPFEGYVYIINREMYGENDYSAPYLIFPSKQDVGASDKGRPGKTLFIPNDQDYFELTKLGESQKPKKAEVFNVILSKKPIPELQALETNQPRKIDQALFDNWRKEWNTGTWQFEQKAGVGASIKKVEKDASLTRKVRLSESDPLPQTVYHVASNSQDALIFEMQIKIRQ